MASLGSWLNPLTVLMGGNADIPFKYPPKESDIFITDLVADF